MIEFLVGVVAGALVASAGWFVKVNGLNAAISDLKAAQAVASTAVGAVQSAAKKV